MTMLNHEFTVKNGHFLVENCKKLNVPSGNTNIFAYHIFGLNVCVHPWIHSVDEIWASLLIFIFWIINFRINSIICYFLGFLRWLYAGYKLPDFPDHCCRWIRLWLHGKVNLGNFQHFGGFFYYLTLLKLFRTEIP